MGMTHPFLRGFLHEVSEKRAFLESAADVAGIAMENPGIAAGVAGASLLAGVGAVKGLRKMQGGKPLFGKMPAPAPAPAAAAPVAQEVRKGFSGKALAGAALAGGAGALYLTRKKSQE
jgi:hypothetical protein